MSKFKIGDIVQCFDKGFEPYIPYGSIGILKEIRSGHYSVNFEFSTFFDDGYWKYYEHELKPAKFTKSKLWKVLAKN